MLYLFLVPTFLKLPVNQLFKVVPELEALIKPPSTFSLPVAASVTPVTSTTSLASTLVMDGMKAVGNTVSKLTRQFSTSNAEQVKTL